MKIKTIDIGSMMMIPKTKQVSKIFIKKSANLAKDRSNIIRKPQARSQTDSDNILSSN